MGRHSIFMLPSLFPPSHLKALPYAVLPFHLNYLEKNCVMGLHDSKAASAHTSCAWMKNIFDVMPWCPLRILPHILYGNTQCGPITVHMLFARRAARTSLNIKNMTLTIVQIQLSSLRKVLLVVAVIATCVYVALLVESCWEYVQLQDVFVLLWASNCYASSPQTPP